MTVAPPALLLMTSSHIGMAFFFVALSTSCSFTLDVDEKACESTQDCVDRGFKDAVCEANLCIASSNGGAGGTGGGGGTGGVPDPRWLCLGTFETPKPPDGEKITYRYHFESATTADPISDLTIKLCGNLDVACTSPIGGLLAPDASANLSIDLDPTFDGYLEITNPGLVPVLAPIGDPVVLPPEPRVVRLVTPGEYVALASVAGATLDTMRASFVLVATDCNDTRAAHVTASTADGDDETIGFYFEGSVPKIDGTETDEQGAAGFINFPSGFVTIEIRRKEDDRFIGKGRFQARGGAITYAYLGPSPE